MTKSLLPPVDPWAWRSNMDAAPLSPLATLKPGPAPTGYDKVFDSVYGYLGGTPDKRSTASALSGLFDVGTMGMATGAYDGGQSLAQTGQPGQMAMAMMPGVKPVGAAAKAAGGAVKELPSAVSKAFDPQPQGIRAYHGSPHDFDRFSLDKIGTGEGHQAFGHGLYFAESAKVAESYRSNLAGSAFLLDGKPYPATKANSPEGKLLEALRFADGTPEGAAAYISGLIKNNYPAAEWEPVLDLAKKMKGRITEVPKGRMYEVNIKANPDDFLDWDKPLSQQSEKVRNAVNERFKDAAPKFREGLERAPMDEVYRLMAPRGSGPSKQRQMVAASKSMRESGVPGIKYLDQGSRAGGEGSRNYVAFDDSLIEILRKYGLLPPAAMGAAAVAPQDASASPDINARK